MTMEHHSYNIYEIEIDLIYVDPKFNTRGTFNPETCRELAADIKENGLINPIILRERDESECEYDIYPYALVSGFRRCEAFKLNDAKVIPAIFRDLTEKEAFSINLSENINREDIGLEQEVEVIDKMLQKGFKPMQIRDSLKRNLNWITNRVFISRLPKEIKFRVYSGEISITEAVDISKERDPYLQTFTLDSLLERDIYRQVMNKPRSGRARGKNRPFRRKAHYDELREYLDNKLPEEDTLFAVLDWLRWQKEHDELKDFFIKNYPDMDWNDFPELILIGK